MPSKGEIVANTVALVTLPRIYMRVKQVVDDPNTSPQDLAKVVSADPSMTARLLRLVNSAFWGFGGQVGSISRAVGLLGMLRVHDVVLASTVATAFKGIRPVRIDVARFWRGSVFRALAATALARKCGLADAERLMVEGLLSDIGHMLLYQQVPELAARALELSSEQADQLPRLERELIGCDYAQVGGALVETWGLPQCFRATIEYQNDPDSAGDHALEAALVHIAGRLAGNEKLVGAAVAPKGLAIAASAWQLTGLDETCLADVVGEARINLSAMTELLCSAPSGGRAH
jgi:HD-like signal output (HDOD) protein